MNQHLSPESFKEAMRYLSGAVTIVATKGHGITATAVCSVSAEPPSLLVCANKENQLAQRIEENRFFSVNILQDKQIELSNVFAGFVKDIPYPRRFESGNWTVSPNGCPLEQEAMVNLECELDKIVSYGTHEIVIGKIISVQIREGKPLLYFDRHYTTLV